MPISFQCAKCKHYTFGSTCEAFPDGIPVEIKTGKFDHTQPYPNAENPQDDGIRFELIDGGE